MKNNEMKSLVDLVLKCVSLGVGIAVLVLNILNKLEVKDSIILLCIGLVCVSFVLINKEK